MIANLHGKVDTHDSDMKMFQSQYVELKDSFEMAQNRLEQRIDKKDDKILKLSQ